MIRGGAGAVVAARLRANGDSGGNYLHSIPQIRHIRYAQRHHTNEDTFQFMSSSVNNEDAAGGASLILYSVNQEGDIVRN